MSDLWIFGAGGHASVVIDLVEKVGGYRIVGVIDDERSKANTVILGHKVIGDWTVFQRSIDSGAPRSAILAIGNNEIRKRLSEKLTDFIFPVIVHSSAILGRAVEIGPGTVVMPGVVIENGARIGSHCILNNNSVIGHNAIIGDYCHISGCVAIGGEGQVGTGAQIGMGAAICPRVKIGAWCKISPCTAALRDVADSLILFGNPPRRLLLF